MNQISQNGKYGLGNLENELLNLEKRECGLGNYKMGQESWPKKDAVKAVVGSS